MTDGDALRQAVLLEPDDDTPRLIYADWLEEHHESERASFIRLQVEAAQSEPFGHSARTAQTRALELLAKNRHQWTQHIPRPFVNSRQFERGFIAHVDLEIEHISTDTFCQLLATEPVQKLKIILPDLLSDFFPLPFFLGLSQLQRIRHLEFQSPHGFLDHDYQELARTPNLKGLRELSFRGQPIQPLWLSDVLMGEAFPNLVALDVADITNLGPALMRGLNRACHRQLKRLDASRVRLNSDQLQQLLASECLQTVEVLKLAFSGRPGDLGPLFHLDIGWVIPWDHLFALDLTGQKLGDEAVRAITVREEAKCLRWLGLSDNDLGPESVRLLVDSKYLALNHLEVKGNRFSTSALVELQQRFPNAVIVS